MVIDSDEQRGDVYDRSGDLGNGSEDEEYDENYDADHDGRDGFVDDVDDYVNTPSDVPEEPSDPLVPSDPPSDPLVPSDQHVPSDPPVSEAAAVHGDEAGDSRAESDGGVAEGNKDDRPKKRIRLATETQKTQPALGIERRKQFKSPPELLGLGPPGCRITLNWNEHRFTGTWTTPVASPEWFDEMLNKSHSASFDINIPGDWKSKLAYVHEFHWVKWEIGEPTCPELKLPKGKQAQKPGQISDDIYQKLESTIQELPPRKKYWGCSSY